VSLEAIGPLTPLAPPYTPRVGVDHWESVSPVVILDPLEAGMNIGRSCFGFRQVQLCFDNAFSVVLTHYQSQISFGHLSSSGMANTLLGPIFGATHHKQVVDLAASVWCPRECFLGRAAPQSKEEILRAQHVLPLSVMCTQKANDTKAQGEQGQQVVCGSSSQLRRVPSSVEATTVTEMTDHMMREVCTRELLRCNREKLIRVYQSLFADPEEA